MTDLKTIEKQCEKLSQSRHALQDVAMAIEKEKRAIAEKYLPKLRKLRPIAERQVEVLRELLKDSPELFAKPRTKTLHGIKVGFKKGSGKVECDDESKVIARIEKRFKQDADQYITTTKKPIKAALNNLDAKELKALGVKITGTEDQIVMQFSDSQIDQLIDDLMKDDESDATED